MSTKEWTEWAEEDNGRILTSPYTETSSLPKQDVPRFLLLILLYLIQGVPIGLAFGSIPFLLKGTDLSYSQVGIFTLASYPYSLKLLWSPVVDSVFSIKFGKRRSWIVPVQLMSGIMLIWLGSKVEYFFSDLEKNLVPLTICFFALILLCATQDIAVDGWALSILSPKALGFASTAQTIGLNSGYFLSFTVFLSFNSPDFANKYLRSVPSPLGALSLKQYLQFWGWMYFLVTVFIAWKVPEQPQSLVRSNIKKRDLELDQDVEEDRVHVWHVYEKMARLLRLPALKIFVLVHLVSKIGFQANEAATNLKLLEKGFHKEDLAVTVLIDFPFEIIFGYYSARWCIGDQPLRPWLYAYVGRLGAAALGQFVVWIFPQDGAVSNWYFLLVILQHLITSFMSTVQFVAICAFHTMIADPAIGGTYMTTLNTLSNLGGQWPRLIVFYLIDNLTQGKCLKQGEDVFQTEDFYTCSSGIMRDACASAGGSCQIYRDGYYATNMLCIAVGGALFFLWIGKTVNEMQRLPEGAWRLR